MITFIIIYILLNIIISIFGAHLFMKEVRKDLPSQSIFCGLIEWFLNFENCKGKK